MLCLLVGLLASVPRRARNKLSELSSVYKILNLLLQLEAVFHVVAMVPVEPIVFGVILLTEVDLIGLGFFKMFCSSI